MVKHITTDDFISSARLVHGDKYDYSMSVYSKAIEKVTIICPIHGQFRQTPNSHTRGRGCPDCGKEKVIQSHVKTNDYFLEKAQKVHGKRYDYSLVEYKNAKEKVAIICDIHGVFYQEAFVHLSGCGCPKCGMIIQTQKRTKSNARFIAESQKKHNNKYDYSLTNYSGAFNKVAITCPTHGIFEQIPHNHIKGIGCPSCAQFGFDVNASSILYFLKFEKLYCSFWKIGVTKNTVRERFGSDADYITFKREWNFKKGKNAMNTEQKVIKAFKSYTLNDFLLPLLNRGGDTECFKIELPFKKVIAMIEETKNKMESE